MPFWHETWSAVADTNYNPFRTYGSSVLLPLSPANNYKPVVMILGGAGASGADPATATTELIDLSAASPVWKSCGALPPVEERVPLVTCPFRAYLHLASDAERLEALAAARELLLPGGRLVFDVFAPSAEDIDETHGRWIEREPGIYERADWDRNAQTLTLFVRGADGASSMTLWWLEPQRWQALLAEAGFVVESCYGWFDRRPYEGGEDSVWVARK